MKINSIVFFGDNCVDKYDKPEKKEFVGGNALNAAVHAAETGCPVSYIGCIGKDREGEQVLKKCRERGIDVSFVQSFDLPTAWTRVELHGGERNFVEEYLFPKGSFRLTEEVLNYIGAHFLIHNTWQGGTEDYLAEFRKRGVKVSMDFGERYSEEFLDGCISETDVAFFSVSPEEADTAGKFAREMNRRGPGMVVVTAGKHGSFVSVKNDSVYFEPARVIDAVDTLGAGDTYIGTFLAYYAAGNGIRQCMLKATDEAARNCMISGGFQNSGIE